MRREVLLACGILSSLLYVGANVVGARRWSSYSVGTILVLLVTCGLTATQASRLEANLPTPWAGVSKRISIGGYLLWQAVLAMMLIGAEAERQLGPELARKRPGTAHF